jgi:hypothetical protein
MVSRVLLTGSMIESVGMLLSGVKIHEELYGRRECLSNLISTDDFETQTAC